MQRLEPGAHFGPYLIEGFIAAGGMGQVFAARHGVYGSPVALKVLHAELHADDSWRLRFNEEGLVGQQLKHPHVLAARELIETDGRVALVLDLVRGGQTLAKVIGRDFATGLPLVQAMQVFLGIVQGVEYAHGKGIVHGDIKPENVLLQGDFRDPATWAPMVTDFGTVGLIAHPVQIEGQVAVVASPRYASPEHLRGVDKLEPRSDIYCLGLILHYLLTGHHASEARTVIEAAEAVQLPIPLVYLVDQPESIIALFKRATQVDPAERYPNCREVALAVRDVLDELGVRLQLEDLRGDLATEVMEERLRMKQEMEDRSTDELETELVVRDLPTAPPEPAPIPLLTPGGAPERVESEPEPQKLPEPVAPTVEVAPSRAWLWGVVVLGLLSGALVMVLVQLWGLGG